MKQMKTKPVIALVEAIGVSSQLAHTFNQRGFDCIHIQSQKDFLPFFKKAFDPSLFIANLPNNSQLLNKLSLYHPQAVIAGMEPGVDLADYLSEQLSLRTNGTHLGRVRRDKALMMNQLKQNNLPSPLTFKSSSLLKIQNFITEHHLKKTVIKPIDSAGCEDVFICQNKQDTLSAFSKILSTQNVMGLENKEILVQEFLSGIEYAVNSVSLDGKHIITDIWQTQKASNGNGGLLYDREKLINDPTIINTLTRYHIDVLNSLEIYNGPAHSEIMLENKRPQLIEVGARIYGCLCDKLLFQQYIGNNQIDLTVDAYTDPNKFRKNQSIYSPSNAVSLVFLQCSKEGYIKKLPFHDRLKQLPSFKKLYSKKSIGDWIDKTTDLCTMPGYVFLSHCNQDQVEADYQWIKTHRSQMFVV